MSSWENASNIFGMNALSMPMPVSDMVKRMAARSDARAVGSTVKVIVPGASVNFTALPSMLMTTCLSLRRSPT